MIWDAILENLKSKKNINIPKDDILDKISEGDVLKFQNRHFVIDNAQTKLRKDEILDITNDIFENDWKEFLILLTFLF